MPINLNQQFDQASIYSDLSSLNSIREQGLTDEYGAVKKAAKEFEAFFMNMMLKSMRQATEVIGEDSLTGSEEEKMFIGMMDEQMSANLSQSGHLGIADLMMSQLSAQYENKRSSDDKKLFDNHRVIRNKRIPTGLGVVENKLIQPKLEPIGKIENKIVRTKSEKLTVEMGNDKIASKIGSHILEENTTQTTDEKRIDSTINLDSNVGLIKPEKKSLFNKISDFVTSLLPYATKAAEKINVDPRVLIAQAALETGWGEFIMHDNKGKPGFNLFGIKSGNSWKGESIKINTLEVVNQEFQKTKATFRKYDSFSDSFDDYVNFLQQNPRYKKALELSQKPQDYVNQLQKSGYATDPNYAKKIMRIFKGSELNNLDVGTK